ncbi:MAG: hypothetical protein KF744_18025 [Taibaiella sp.]|nr:hypothetical protein [Taibaiella sp.]
MSKISLAPIGVMFTALLVMSSSSFAQGSPEYNKWILKGFELYSTGQYKPAAEAYSKAFSVAPAVPEDRYNAACAWSMATIPDSAFFHLQHLANKDNFTDIATLEKDKDLASLHTDKRWAALAQRVAENKKNAENRFNKELAAQLETLYQRDQAPRKELMQALTKNGKGSAEVAAASAKMKTNDSLNTVEIKAIIDKYGWPGPDAVGHDGNNIVFLIVQHASLFVQHKYLPTMRKAVKEGNAQTSDLALLEDRVALGHHRKQTYGTQISSDPQGDFLAPLADPDHIDQLRAKMGLGPIAEYLESFGLKWNVQDYKKQLPGYIKRQSAIE